MASTERSGEGSTGTALIVGLVSDTHGVYDPALALELRSASLILHAGDVGHHGLHQEVLAELQKLAPVTAVRGNVDDGAGLDELPEAQLLTLNGWRILMTHIVGVPPKVTAATQALQAEHKPDIIISGHTHVFSETRHAGVHFINAGSAGPARFGLQRTAALLELPAVGAARGADGAAPRLHRIQLAGKAPPRLKPACSARQKSTAPAAGKRKRVSGKRS